MNKYLEEYNRAKEILLKNKKDYEERLDAAIKKYENIKNSNIDKKETMLLIASKNVIRRKEALRQINDKISFLRPANSDDVAYRMRQYDDFSKTMQGKLPQDMPLRFHGCPIYNAKHIIESGEISSSVDRLGFETSYDVGGQISVTTIDTIDITVQGYSGLIENFNLPAGCIFVLLPSDDKDARSGQSLLMGNVNIRKEPNRLFAIITTPENIEIVSKWAQEYKIDTSKICDYDSFILQFKKKNNKKQ